MNISANYPVKTGMSESKRIRAANINRRRNRYIPNYERRRSFNPGYCLGILVCAFSLIFLPSIFKLFGLALAIECFYEGSQREIRDHYNRHR